ncbi:glycosyltransferase [Candidatus Woesearchaeota archaeon]|nr:glycosyltransferase [Candidatus Woesearchaeota archaeon]
MLSIIIPTLDEATVIGKTLAHTQRLDGDYEILVVDGESTDATRKIAEQTGVRVIKANRGLRHQLETGVKEAKGDSYLFLHADTLLPMDAISRVNELEGYSACGFKQRYDAFNILANTQALINNGNAKLFGRFCGEHAFFLTKQSLLAAGGVPHVHAFETERLSSELKKVGIKPELLTGPVVCSARRFTKRGISTFLGLNWAHGLNGLGFADWKLKKHFLKVR